MGKIKYEVHKYFDTYPDGLAFSTYNEEEAKNKCNKLNEKIKHLPKTKYIIREIKEN
jgi:hypothetical protein